jgi:hypothetical protein
MTEMTVWYWVGKLRRNVPNGVTMLIAGSMLSTEMTTKRMVKRRMPPMRTRNIQETTKRKKMTMRRMRRMRTMKKTWKT